METSLDTARRPAVELECYPMTATPPDLVPGRQSRNWMDAFASRHPYRCLPLNMANTTGWEILCPFGFSAEWTSASGLFYVAPATETIKSSLHSELEVELGAGPDEGGAALRFGLPAAPHWDRLIEALRALPATSFLTDPDTALGWAPTEATPRNPIIVIEYEGQMRGLIVHDVADIVSIEAGTLQQPDAMGHETITHFLEGIAPLGDDMVMVLDLARLMADEPIELAA